MALNNLKRVDMSLKKERKKERNQIVVYPGNEGTISLVYKKNINSLVYLRKGRNVT